MANFYTSENCSIARLTRIIIFVLFFLITLPLAKAQTACPDPGGGATTIQLGSGDAIQRYYPGSLPSGASGFDKATAGFLRNQLTMNAVYTKRVITIHPELPGSPGPGYVTLKFQKFNMNAAGAVIKVYRGADETGTLDKTITSGTAASFTGTSESYTGPVTVTFESTTPDAGGNFDIDMKYMTGDQLIPTTALGYKAAVWTAFMQPNSYTLIDELKDDVTSVGTPICIAFFDANRQFASSEVNYCLDHDRSTVSLTTGHYPGRMIFQKLLNYDIDRSGAIDDVDRLKTARVAWIVANAPTGVDRDNLQSIEMAIWTTISVNYEVDYGGLHGAAMAAVPDLPTPAEPDFSITAPATAPVAGAPTTFTVNFNLPAGYDPADYGAGPQQLKLVIPAGVKVTGVTGNATYAGGILTFTSLPASAAVTVVSSKSQIASIKAIYEKSGFWNVQNLNVFTPCGNSDGHFQDFVGVHTGGDITYPYREASATWAAPSPLSCDDGYYQILGPGLYRLDKTQLQQSTLLTIVPIDYNAIGYNVNDNFLWGYSRATNQIFKLGSDGSELFTIPNLPTPATSASGSVGTVDLNGYLYLYEPNATEYITIDVNSSRSTYLQMVDPTNSYIAKTSAPWGTPTTPRNISDWAYNPTTGLLHAIINAGGSDPYFISHLNPVTGVSTLSAAPVSGTNFDASTAGAFNSQFFDAAGNLIVFTKLLFSIDLSSNVATELFDKSQPVSNDGASCPLINAPVSFACNSLYYQVETDKLYSVNETGVRTLVATLSGNLNAMGYNAVDNFVWGYDNASSQVFKLGINGVIQRFAISNIPAATHPDGYSVGTVSTTGYLYLYEKNGSQYITVDINPARTETYLKLVDPTTGFTVKTSAPWGTALTGGASTISDWAFNPSDSQIYALTDGTSATPYQVLQLNPLTGASTLLAGQVTGGGLETSGQDFGSSIIDANGNFIVFGNTTGYYYRVNLSTKAATQLSNVASPSASNDGAFCPLALSPPMPVVLVSFETYLEENIANLAWTTAEETNSMGFEIERSVDASHWTQIGFVEAQSQGASSTVKRAYSFKDTAPLDGLNYYRLKMVDLDGTYAYSQIRKVNLEGMPAATLYPNPTATKVYLRNVDLGKVTTVSISSIDGRYVYSYTSITSDGIDVANLNPGLYVLSITSQGQSKKTLKLFVTK